MKWLFDRIMSLFGLVCLFWIFPIVAVLIKVKMPGPVFYKQKRVGKDGRLFTMVKFRTMTVGQDASSVSVAGQSRITPLGAKLRKYKIDELPELWNVLIGDMSFVGPRPDVPGYADALQGDDRLVLSLRPGITGPATLKYRDEEEMIASYVAANRGRDGVTDEALALWYNDNVLFPDKVRLNLLYLEKQSVWLDLKMIFATVLGHRITFAGETI